MDPSSPLNVTTSDLDPAAQGNYYSAALDSDGGTGPVTWSVSSGSLPAGLTLDPNAGVISGTPTGFGTSYFTVQATDSSTPSAQTATASVSLEVVPQGNSLTPQSISFTPSASGKVGRTVTLSATGGGSGNPVVFALDPSSGTGVCSLSGANDATVTYAAVGSCVIDANQAGDASYAAAPQVQGTITVGQGTQSISFTPPSSGTVGGSVTLSGTGGGSGNPVVFSVDPSSGAGVCAVSGTNGTTLNYTAGGSCVIDANQAGNAGYAPAPQVRKTITVHKAAQSISFTPPASGVVGAPVTLSATGGGSGIPVIFSVDPSSGAGVCAVSGTNGTTLNYTAGGSCVIDANQAGNASYAPAPQVQDPIPVAKATSQTVLSLSSPSETYGQEKSLVITVTVSPQFAGTPTGTVTVVAGSKTLCSKVPLSSGKATCSPASATALTVGKYGITATYSGSAQFDASTSSATTLTIAKATSETVLSLSKSSVAFGQEKSLVISVTVSPQFAGTPTGTVTVVAGSKTLCSKVPLSSGKATCSPASATILPNGKYSVKATYSGSAQFGTSTSAAKSLTIT